QFNTVIHGPIHTISEQECAGNGYQNLCYGLQDVTRLKIGDFNGDGRSDLAFLNGVNTRSTSPKAAFYTPNSNSQAMSVYLTTGTGCTGPIVGPLRGMSILTYQLRMSILFTVPDTLRLEVADFNGDGKQDLLAIEGGQGTVDYIGQGMKIYL